MNNPGFIHGGMSLLQTLNHAVYSSVSGGGEEPQYTNWWQGIGDVVPLSDTYTIYDPLAAADLASSYVNLANPGTRNATAPVAAPAHAQGIGWTFNGSTQYLNSNTKPGQISTVICWVDGYVSGTYAFGYSAFTPTRFFYVRPQSGSNHAFGKGPSVANVELSIHGGVFAMNATHGFFNGNREVALPAWSGADPNIDMFIGCQNSGGAANFFGGRILRMAIYPGVSLTDAEIEAVTLAMVDYNVGELHSYSQKVLSLNPFLYYPCNEGIGSVLLDHSGNKYHGETFKCTTGSAGLYGNAVLGGSDPLDTMRPNYKFIADQPLDQNEFSYSTLFYADGNSTDQVRIFETHMTVTANSPLGDYIAVELRGGNELHLFFKEDGVTQQTGSVVFISTSAWHHFVFYNSLTSGVFGIYVDGVKYEFSKTSVVGITGTLTSRYPYFSDETAGLTQHLALFDYVLTQEQVNSLGIS